MSIGRADQQLSTADYERKVAEGTYGENDRVELLHGEVIKKVGIGKYHAACVRKLTQLFTGRFATQAFVSVQNPVRLTGSEPEPDVALLKIREDYYESSHPEPQDVLLLIEVAANSIDYDREVKRAIYAVNGIAEFLIIDVARRTLEVHRQPLPTGHYDEVETLAANDLIEIERLPGDSFIVRDFFPPTTN
jgi:hypothetical protein